MYSSAGTRDSDKVFLIVTLILSEHQCSRCARILREKSLCDGIILRGQGTVKSQALNILGIRSQKREIIKFLLEKDKAVRMLDMFTEELQLDSPGHGIAYTSPVTTFGAPGPNTGESTHPEREEEENTMYKKLTVIVNRGMAEDVMDIARKAGAKGGTILHGRGTGAEIAAKLFGMDIEPEKELVIILMPSELAAGAADALMRELDLGASGSGILFVEPVLEVRGLSSYQDCSPDHPSA